MSSPIFVNSWLSVVVIIALRRGASSEEIKRMELTEFKTESSFGYESTLSF